MNSDTFRAILEPKTKSKAMLKTRSAYLAQLYRELDSKTTDLGFLNNTRAVLQQIRNSDNPNTQKTRIFHVMAVLRLPAGKVVLKKNKDLYDRIAAQLKSQGNAIYAENVMNEKQKERYMSLGGLTRALERAIIDLFDNKYKVTRFHKPAKMSTEEFDRLNIASIRENNIYTFARDLQALSIIACYVWQPALRNDYGTLEITRKAVGLKNDRNWLQIRKNGDLIIVMNKYKNAKSLGKRIIQITNPKLKWILTYWHDLLGRLIGSSPKSLFYYTINANHMVKKVEDSRSLGRQIPRIAEKVFGRPLSVNDFRHIWEIEIQNTDEYKRGTLAERTKMHEQLLHGHTMGVQYALQRRDDNVYDD